MKDLEVLSRQEIEDIKTEARAEVLEEGIDKIENMVIEVVGNSAATANQIVNILQSLRKYK